MRVTLGTAQLVEDQIPCNFQQPGGEFGPRHVSARAFPHPDEDLLRDVLHLRIAAQHARDRAGYQSLMPLDELLECPRIASTHEPH
jgi:hypothetical protein